MFDSLALPWLIVIFLGAAAVVWWAGVQLSNTTDVLDRRLGIGDALGGLVLLAVVQGLPDLAVVGSAAIGGNVGLATGTLLGAVSVQTLVLVLVDVVGGGTGTPLTRRTKTLVPVLTAMMVIIGLTLLVTGSQLEAATVFRIEPVALLIFLMWIAGLLVVGKAYAGLAWNLDTRDDPGAPEEPDDEAGDASTAKTVATFLVVAGITLVGGFVLEQSGDAIATELGINSLIFGATALAVATAIPDTSTGIQAVRLGDHQLVITKGFGANAFLPTLFLMAGVMSGTAVVSELESTAIYFAGIGMLLTSIYLVGLVMRSHRTVLRMGVDSLLVLITYAIGVAVVLTIG